MPVAPAPALVAAVSHGLGAAAFLGFALLVLASRRARDASAGTLRVAHGLPFNGYIGTITRLQPRDIEERGQVARLRAQEALLQRRHRHCGKREGHEQKKQPRADPGEHRQGSHA